MASSVVDPSSLFNKGAPILHLILLLSSYLVVLDVAASLLPPLNTSSLGGTTILVPSRATPPRFIPGPEPTPVPFIRPIPGTNEYIVEGLLTTTTTTTVSPPAAQATATISVGGQIAQATAPVAQVEAGQPGTPQAQTMPLAAVVVSTPARQALPPQIQQATPTPTAAAAVSAPSEEVLYWPVTGDQTSTQPPAPSSAAIAAAAAAPRLGEAPQSFQPQLLQSTLQQRAEGPAAALAVAAPGYGEALQRFQPPLLQPAFPQPARASEAAAAMAPPGTSEPVQIFQPQQQQQPVSQQPAAPPAAVLSVTLPPPAEAPQPTPLPPAVAPAAVAVAVPGAAEAVQGFQPQQQQLVPPEPAAAPAAAAAVAAPGAAEAVQSFQPQQPEIVRQEPAAPSATVISVTLTPAAEAPQPAPSQAAVVPGEAVAVAAPAAAEGTQSLHPVQPQPTSQQASAAPAAAVAVAVPISAEADQVSEQQTRAAGPPAAAPTAAVAVAAPAAEGSAGTQELPQPVQQNIVEDASQSSVIVALAVPTVSSSTVRGNQTPVSTVEPVAENIAAPGGAVAVASQREGVAQAESSPIQQTPVRAPVTRAHIIPTPPTEVHEYRVVKFEHPSSASIPLPAVEAESRPVAAAVATTGPEDHHAAAETHSFLDTSGTAPTVGLSIGGQQPQQATAQTHAPASSLSVAEAVAVAPESKPSPSPAPRAPFFALTPLTVVVSRPSGTATPTPFAPAVAAGPAGPVIASTTTSQAQPPATSAPTPLAAAAVASHNNVASPTSTTRAGFPVVSLPAAPVAPSIEFSSAAPAAASVPAPAAASAPAPAAAAVATSPPSAAVAISPPSAPEEQSSALVAQVAPSIPVITSAESVVGPTPVETEKLQEIHVKVSKVEEAEPVTVAQLPHPLHAEQAAACNVHLVRSKSIKAGLGMLYYYNMDAVEEFHSVNLILPDGKNFRARIEAVVRDPPPSEEQPKPKSVAHLGGGYTIELSLDGMVLKDAEGEKIANWDAEAVLYPVILEEVTIREAAAVSATPVTTVSHTSTSTVVPEEEVRKAVIAVETEAITTSAAAGVRTPPVTEAAAVAVPATAESAESTIEKPKAPAVAVAAVAPTAAETPPALKPAPTPAPAAVAAAAQVGGSSKKRRAGSAGLRGIPPIGTRAHAPSDTEGASSLPASSSTTAVSHPASSSSHTPDSATSLATATEKAFQEQKKLIASRHPAVLQSGGAIKSVRMLAVSRGNVGTVRLSTSGQAAPGMTTFTCVFRTGIYGDYDPCNTPAVIASNYFKPLTAAVIGGF